MRRTVLDFSFAASMLKYKYVPINSTTTIYNRGTFVDELEKKLKKHSSLFYSPTANQKRVAEGFASYRAMNTLEQTKQHMFAYATKDNFVQKEGLGGVFVGVGVVPEFFCKSDSTNAINSMVSNPLNEMLSVGGSSGGSAAAVAAGLAHIGLGTEFGGSIVTPATCCGVLGYKSVDTNGFFVNSLSDLLFVLNNLRKEFPNSSGDYDKVGNITIGTIALPDPFVVDQEIISSTMLMYEYLAGYFECRELNLFDKVYLPIWSKTGNINTLWREKVKPIASANKCDDPVLRELLNVNSEGLAQAEGWKSTTTTDFNNFLSTVDVLVIPATSSKAWPQAHYHPKSFHTSEWKTMYSEKLSQECMPTNLLFTQHNIFSLPSVWAKKICITMPIGFTASLESGIIPLAVTLVLNDATDGKCQDREKWNKFIAVALQVQEFCMQQVSK